MDPVGMDNSHSTAEHLREMPTFDAAGASNFRSASEDRPSGARENKQSIGKKWCPGADSNHRHADFQTPFWVKTPVT